MLTLVREGITPTGALSTFLYLGWVRVASSLPLLPCSRSAVKWDEQLAPEPLEPSLFSAVKSLPSQKFLQFQKATPLSPFDLGEVGHKPSSQPLGFRHAAQFEMPRVLPWN